MSGKNVIKAIKHSILNLPKLDGRFAHVSGLKYSYDSRKDPTERLINVQVNRYNEEEKFDEFNFIDIEPDKYYSVASREYTMNGGDGFESFGDPENETIVDDERGVPLSVLLRNFFWAIETVNDAIKLTKEDQDENEQDQVDQDEKFVDDLNNLMTRFPLSVLLRNFFWAIETVNDAIKLTKEDQDQNQVDQDQKFVDDLDGLMTRLGIKNQNYVDEQKEDQDQSELQQIQKKIELLTVEPLIEGRIVDIADTEKDDNDKSEINGIII
eukprot:CAMPEP_0201593188 /NCGR_PEP_ID=MMETSP0190_2-20130828/190878_1 /ASSEMBLY_ACC=CAM_ASM_000263 /TAXON_ID=37353 /ORGANISM="Rosalina sp." /LENGTH=267 /DNA_ID=CAMNT_0048052301 /DNA_START=647 /DNA_END=1451 /DNA_ORIENTATION=-